MKHLQTYDPGSLDVRAQVERYLDRTGLTHSDFARRIGYSTVAVHFFLQGRYKGSLDNICGASKEFMALHPVAQPASAEGRLYETANVRAWREIFHECLERGGKDDRRAAVVYGPPGIQKTKPIKALIAEINAANLAEGKLRAYYIYCRQDITPAQLLKRVAEACGTSPLGYADRVLRNLRF